MDLDKINKLNEKKFKETNISERVIFIPHCLRNKDCPAKNSENGWLCINCGRCNIGEFKKRAEMMGYRVFICSGFSAVKKLIEKNKPKAVVGVSCKNEMEMAGKSLKGMVIQGVELNKDGCVETDVDWEKVKKVCFKNL